MAASSSAAYGVVAVSTLAAAWAGGRGLRLIVRGLRCADDPCASLWVIRGIRGIVVAVSVAALGSGLAFAQTWLAVFGTVFLAEELYETGVVTLVLRAGTRRHGGRPPAACPEVCGQGTTTTSAPPGTPRP